MVHVRAAPWGLTTSVAVAVVVLSVAAMVLRAVFKMKRTMESSTAGTLL